MPAISKHERLRGGWVAEGVTPPRRHYKAADLDCVCDSCGGPIPRQLVRGGVFTHPTCPERPA